MMIDNLRELSTLELFNLVKWTLLKVSAGGYVSDEKLQSLYDECLLRDVAIYEDAAADVANEVSLHEEKLLGMSLSNPLRGKYLGGERLLSEANLDTDSFESDSSQGLFGIAKDKLLIVNVKGDSMINAGIEDGDSLICELIESPENGKIMIVSVGGLLYVKRVKISKDKIILISENTNYPPYEIKSEDTLQIIAFVRRTVKKTLP